MFSAGVVHLFLLHYIWQVHIYSVMWTLFNAVLRLACSHWRLLCYFFCTKVWQPLNPSYLEFRFMCVHTWRFNVIMCYRVESNEFTLGDRQLAPAVVSQPSQVIKGEAFNVTMEIVDAVTREKVSNIGWKVYTDNLTLICCKKQEKKLVPFLNEINSVWIGTFSTFFIAIIFIFDQILGVMYMYLG